VGVLIDTTVLVALERSGGDLGSLREELRDEEVAISALTASELLHGVHRADTAVRRGRRERFVEGLLEALPVVPFDLETARVHARLGADLHARGEPIGAHDLIVAATAITLGFRLASLDVRHFSRVEGIDLLDWPEATATETAR
jgi:tRNA(fMet)-specific endonuclease VapC